MSERNDIRAVAYLRRSRVDASRTGAVSHEQQTTAVREMAKQAGFADLTILEDWGRSGKSANRRPGYQQLRASIESGTITDLFSYDLSRLTRSLEDWASLANLCREHRVRIHFREGGSYDLTTTSGKLLLDILASVAEAVRGWSSERSRVTAATVRARGDTIGRKPYGSRPGEDIEAVKAAYIDAGTFYGAARLLNDRAVPVAQVTNRPAREDKVRKWVPASVSWIIRHQAPDLALEHAGTAGPRRTSRYVLQGIVRCVCGRTLSPYTYKSGRKSYVTYRCSGGRADKAHPRPYAVPEHVLVDWARAESEYLQMPGDRVKMRDESNARRGDLDARRARILDMYEGGHVDRDERDRRLAPVYAELERIDDAAAAINVVDIPAVDWTLPADRLNTVLRALWHRIDLGPDMRPLRAEWTVPEWRTA